MSIRVRVRARVVELALVERNITRREFARLIGIHPSHLSAVLCGRHPPGPKVRRLLQAALRKTFGEVFEIEEAGVQPTNGGSRLDEPAPTGSPD